MSQINTENTFDVLAHNEQSFNNNGENNHSSEITLPESLNIGSDLIVDQVKEEGNKDKEEDDFDNNPIFKTFENFRSELDTISYELDVHSECLENKCSEDLLASPVKRKSSDIKNVIENQSNVESTELLKNEIDDEVVKLKSEIEQNEEMISNLTKEQNELDNDIIRLFEDTKPTDFQWAGSAGLISSDCTFQIDRRRKRESLFVKYSLDQLYDFMNRMLNCAWEHELLSESQDIKYYVFDPYLPKAYHISEKMDTFSKFSSEKRMGIKTNLSIDHANFILSCYYLIYSSFDKTSDETIFEEEYRNSVLMRDPNSSFSKYFDFIIENIPENIDGITSMLNAYLDLSYRGEDSVQYNCWLLTMSKQTKQVNVQDDESGFISLFELMKFLNDKKTELSSKTASSSQQLSCLPSNFLRFITNENDEKEDNIDNDDDKDNEKMDDKTRNSDTVSEDQNCSLIKENEGKDETECLLPLDIVLSPTSEKRENKKQEGLLAGLFTRVTSYFMDKIKTD